MGPVGPFAPSRWSKRVVCERIVAANAEHPLPMQSEPTVHHGYGSARVSPPKLLSRLLCVVGAGMPGVAYAQAPSGEACPSGPTPPGDSVSCPPMEQEAWHAPPPSDRRELTLLAAFFRFGFGRAWKVSGEDRSGASQFDVSLGPAYSMAGLDTYTNRVCSPQRALLAEQPSHHCWQRR